MVLGMKCRVVVGRLVVRRVIGRGRRVGDGVVVRRVVVGGCVL